MFLSPRDNSRELIPMKMPHLKAGGPQESATAQRIRINTTGGIRTHAGRQQVLRRRSDRDQYRAAKWQTRQTAVGVRVRRIRKITTAGIRTHAGRQQVLRRRSDRDQDRAAKWQTRLTAVGVRVRSHNIFKCFKHSVDVCFV